MTKSQSITHMQAHALKYAQAVYQTHAHAFSKKGPCCTNTHTLTQFSPHSPILYVPGRGCQFVSETHLNITYLFSFCFPITVQINSFYHRMDIFIIMVYFAWVDKTCSPRLGSFSGLLFCMCWSAVYEYRKMLSLNFFSRTRQSPFNKTG